MPAGRGTALTTAAAAPPVAAAGEVLLEVDASGPRRRWTVLARAVLCVAVAAWTGLVGLAALGAAVACWFAVLATGRRPAGPTRLLRGQLGLVARTLGYAMMLTDSYPPFELHPRRRHPVRVVVPALGPGGRVSVLFRGLLVSPAVALGAVLLAGWVVTAPVAWGWLLLTGRTPASHREATAAVLRWSIRCLAHQTLLTDRYPDQLAGPPRRPARAAYTAEDLVALTTPIGPGGSRLGRRSRLLLVGYLVLGLGALAAAAEDGPLVRQAVSGTAADPTVPGAGARTADPSAELLSHVPVAVRSSCRAIQDTDGVLAPGETSALSCSVGAPGRPVSLLYRLYPDPPGTRGSYQRLRAAAGDRLSDPNTACDQGRAGAGGWRDSADQVAGSLACGVLPPGPAGPATAFVVWTDDARHVGAELDSSALGLPELFAVWAARQLIR